MTKVEVLGILPNKEEGTAVAIIAERKNSAYVFFVDSDKHLWGKDGERLSVETGDEAYMDGDYYLRLPRKQAARISTIVLGVDKW